MGMNFEAVGARISRLQAHDLPAALSGLLRQAELALKPASKTVKCKGSGLSTVQKRALVTAIVLLLEKAGTELNCGVVREDLQTQLQAAFQQHSWLWERILRVNLADVLQSPGAALLIMQVLLSLTSTHQARALNLIRKQLSQGLRISPSAAEQASCSAILSLVLSHLKRCFPVVSYVLPSSDTAAQSSSSQRLSPGRSSSQVKVSLAEQLPALLHLALILAAPCPEGRGAQADVLAGLHTRNSCSTVPQSTSESDAGLESHMAPPGLAASRVASQQMGVCTKEASGAGKTCMPQKSAGTMAPSFVGHVVEDQHRGDSLSGQAEEVLQYAVLLLSRLESPERLHELLGFGQGSAPDQLPDPEGSWSREGPTGRLRSGVLSKIHAAQQCMEVMLEALLTLPGFAAATAKQPHSSVTSSETRAQLAPRYEEVLQRCQGQEGEGRGEAPGPYVWWAAVDGHPWQGSARAESCRAVLQQANKTVAVLLALHWELTKLEAACLAAPQGRSSRGQLPHLSPRGCLQLLRASTCKPKTAPSARLLASMPRAGAAMSQLPPAVQLLLPPAIMAHALELASRAMGSSGAASWLGGSPDGANVANSNDGEDSHCSGNNATCGAAPQPGESLLAERSRDRQGRGLLGELAERVLDIQQAAFQGLEQPRAVLYGPLHRQVISAASKLHSLLTQPPVAPAKGCAADADAVAASAVCDIGAEDVLDGEGVGASRRLPSDRKRRLSCLSDAVLARGGSGSVKRGRDAAAAARTQQLPGTFLETAAAQGSSAHLKVRAAKGTSQRTSPGSFGRDGLHANPVAELLLLFEQQLPAEAVLATHAVVAEGPQTTEDSQAAGRASGPAATGRTRSRDAAVRRRLVPQQVVQSSLAQRTQHAQHGEVAAQHCAVDHPTLARGRYADHDARTAAASSRGDPPAGAAPAAARTRQEGTSNPEEQGAGEKSSASALYLGADAAEGGWEGPAMGQALAAVQRAQQEGGRVILTAAAALDDAGREALWEAYISDKEYLVEMLGDSNYQEWYDEEAHPLPELHTSRLKGVDAVLDEALGSPLGGEGLEGSGDEAPPPPGPQTLLAASVQLPWQATLAAALQLLCCCLGLAVSSANGRAGRNSSIRGGHGCGAASEVHASQPAGGESSRAQLVALSLFEALEPKQRGEAAVAAARLATPHCSSVAAAKAIRGAGSRPLGAVLLIFAVQLHEVVHRRTGCRTAPVLLSAYTSLLDALLPLAQHEELHIKCAIPGSAKRAPTTPLLLLPPVLLCVLESPRLLPSSLLPRTLCCLLRLSRPCTPQDAITQHASLLWALLLPRPSRRSALPPPCWVATPTCTQLLRRLKPALAAAAAQELLQLLSADWEAWEQHGAMKEEPPPHSLGRRALPVQSAGDAAGRGGPQGSSRSRLRKKKPARGTKAKASECGVAENASHQQLGALSQTGNMPQRVQKGGAEGAGQDSDRDWKQLSGDAMMEGLLPAVDLCCFALTQMAAQQQRQMYQQNAWCEEMEGVGGVAGPLCHPSVGALVLTLCQQLVSYCTSLLQRLSCCLDSATQESSPCPPGISQAGLMWAVSLEMKSCLEQADAVVLPQSALARQQQLLREALQELGGVQYCCAELAKGLPEHHSAYQALVAAMDSAPSLSTFSTQAGNEGAEEQGANGCLGGAETETGRQQGSRGCAPNGQGPLEKKKEDDGRHQRRRLQDIKNPFLRAMIAEGGNHVDDLAGDDLSDLEDFIVYNPEKDYQQLFAQHFPAALDSGDNDVEETDDEGIGDGLEEEGREPLHKLPDVPRWSHSAISSSHPEPAKPGASGQLRQLIPHT